MRQARGVWVPCACDPPCVTRTRTKMVDGRGAEHHYFASQGEATRYAELTLLLRAGEIEALRLHPRYELRANDGTALCKVVADFEYRDRRREAEVVPPLELPPRSGPRTRPPLVTEDVKVRGWRKSERTRLRDELFRIKAALFRSAFGREIEVVER